MNQANARLYIRFGEIPPTGKSKVYASGEPIGEELGVSVYRAVEANGMYFPLLPEEANEAGVADYFRLLMESDTRVYLVTGDEMRFEGHDREPLLMNPTVISDITHYYRKLPKEEA